MTVDNPTYVFYNDLPEPRLSKAIDDLKFQSQNALSSPSPPSAWGDTAYDRRRGYIRSLRDHCIPTIAQEMMVKYSGIEWALKEIDSGHVPFLSRTDELISIVVKMAGNFC